MIDVREVVKTFDGFRALAGLSFHVPKGAVYGLVGPNGAGKSTIIRHLTGIYRQDAGEITIDGAPVFENPAVKGAHCLYPGRPVLFPPGQHPGDDALLWGHLSQLQCPAL